MGREHLREYERVVNGHAELHVAEVTGAVRVSEAAGCAAMDTWPAVSRDQCCDTRCPLCDECVMLGNTRCPLCDERVPQA